MRMTELGQITIPKAMRDQCGLTPNGEVEMTVKNGTITVQPKRDLKSRDLKSFDEALKKWYGSGAGRLKELGFENTDDLIEALRGR